MGLYQRYVVPLLVNAAMQHAALLPYRQRIAGAAQGRVLEFGVGSGINLPLYGNRVTHVVGIDPSARLLHMARDRQAKAQAPIEMLEGNAEALPLETGSIDTVVTTWTLCSIPDVRRALHEARRVLRHDGQLLFVEHGKAPEPGVADWQDRLDPLWTRIAGGCHLNRPIDRLIASCGFRIDTMRNSRIPGPRTHTFLYEGRAQPA